MIVSPLKLTMLECRCVTFPSVDDFRKRAKSSPDEISGGIGSCRATRIIVAMEAVGTEEECSQQTTSSISR